MRWETSDTLAFSFSGKDTNLLTGSQNPARGFAGTCGGDSGGPVFYETSMHTELQVGVTSSGDSICRASSIIARTEGAEAAAFLTCVKLHAPSDSVSVCGCTQVDSKGLCPSVP